MPHDSPGPAARFGYSLYGLYALTVFALGVLTTVIVVTVTPGQDRRRRFVARIIRTTFLTAGIRPAVTGLSNLPDGPCVVVANHASYVDGLLLKAFLPPRFSFVIKGEMRNNPLVHFVLRRSGARFVERFGSGTRDIREFVRAARGGAALGFFPEGTFIEEPGILRFRPGAFLAAIKAGIPVAPVGIRGTRRMLPAGRMLPWPSRVQVDVLPAITPDAPEYGDYHALAETARQRILATVGEPDLLEAS